ncbi:hypothetical protein [Tropicimonas marinistellae]|uniref:hypothetical protein n=1 Tax=Tropicimonas marinistellae TaxID=1739787 RepID=UPI00082B9A4E|nr:hypothetical protein [Tropicimonas marinistellae]
MTFKDHLSPSIGGALLGIGTGALLTVGAALAEQALEPVELSDMRGMRYCEVLLIYEEDVVIYNTSASDGCPEDRWQAMDTAALASENGAKAAQLNGPKFWATDGQTLLFGDTKSFGGIEARYAATLPISALGTGEGADPYVGFTSSKKQTMVFNADRPIYELIDPDGNAYILNAYGPKVKDGDPANLADQLSPAEGWSFRISTPTEDLVIAAPEDEPTHMVGDDLRQYYTRYDAGTN